MVEVGKDAVGFEMGHDVAVYNMFKNLAGDSCEVSVVSWGVMVAFLKGTGDIGS